jgi:hypothetical protein
MRKGAALFVLCLTAGVAHAQWGPEVPLTNTGSDLYGEGLAVSGSTVHVIYGGGVRYRKSVDNGVTFGSEKTLDGAGNIHLTDPLIADGNDVWAIYLKNQTSVMDWCCPRDNGDIYLLHSGDAGETWDVPKRLTTAQGAYRVSIAYAAGRLHIVWMDYRSNAWDVYYLRSSDRGATWDPEKRIAQSAGTFGSERPQVAARGNGVFVTIWDDRGTNPQCMAGPTFTFSTCPDTFFIGSLDGGTTWGTEIPVSYSGAAIAGRNDIAATDTSLVINFNRAAENTADANPHLFVARSPDDGATWQPAQQLTNTSGSSDHGSIIASRRSVFLAWHDSRSGTLEIYYTHSTDDGQSWIPDELVSTSNAEGSTPLIAFTQQFVHVLWLDKRTGPYQIMYRHRDRPPELFGDDAGVEPGGDAGINPPAEDPGCCYSGNRTPSLLPLFAFVWSVMARRRRRRR